MHTSDTTITTIAAINRDWALRCDEPASATALAAWAAREPALAGAACLADLSRLGAGPVQQDAVLGALLRCAQQGPYPALARTVLVHRFTGTLVRCALSTAHHFGSVDAAAAAALMALYEVLARYPLAARPALVAASIKLDTLHRMLRDGESNYLAPAMRHAGVGEDLEGPDRLVERLDALDVVAAAVALRIVDGDDPAVAKWSQPAARVDHRDRMLAVLVAAVRGAMVSAQAAALLTDFYRADARGDQRLAAERGCSQAALRQRRSRTIARLRTHQQQLALVA